MEDLASMITQFLGSEEGMDQLRSVAAALGLPDPASGGGSGGVSGGPDSAPDPGAQQPGVPPGFGGVTPPSGPPQSGFVPPASGSSAPPIDLDTAVLLGKVLAAYNQSDKNTELLRALKPHFSPERAKKVDDALRILQLIRLLPLLRDSGLLGGGKNR